MFHFFTHTVDGNVVNSRIFAKNEFKHLTVDGMINAGWTYNGIVSIDEVPKSEFPFYVTTKFGGYDILEVREKSVKIKEDGGMTFFMPKSQLFKDDKLNIDYWRIKAKKESEEWFNRKRGLTK